MEQNQKSSNSEGRYKKLYRKFTLSHRTPSLSSQKKTTNPRTDHHSGEVAVTGAEQGNDQKLSSVKGLKPTKDEGKFSDYIRKVKERMRSVSSVGGGKNATRRESFNDKVSHYINRAKFKIRTTTIVGNDDN